MPWFVLLIERVGLVWLAVRMLAVDPFGVFSGLECWRAGCLEIGLWIVRMAFFLCALTTSQVLWRFVERGLQWFLPVPI
jgi:hypothetical protein